MFNQSGTIRSGTASSSNPMQDFEVVSPPDDSISSLKFSPASLQQNFLVAGSWDCNVRCWEVEQSGKTVPKSIQSMAAPILDVCWSDVSLFLIDYTNINLIIILIYIACYYNNLCLGWNKSIYGFM